MNKRPLVIFDFDGVIVDSLNAAHSTWVEAGATISLPEYKKRFEGNINNADKPLEELDFFAAYSPRIPHLTLFPGIENSIAKLASKHILTINSSALSGLINQVLEKYNLLQYFDAVLGNDTGTSKVKKIKTILNTYNIAPPRAVMITDTLGDLREANETNIQTIAVTWGFHDKETLAKGVPSTIVNQTNELPTAVEQLLPNIPRQKST